MYEIKKYGFKISNLYSILIDNIAVFSDLHIGYEGVLRMEGAMIPKYQKKVIKKRIEEIIRRYNPDKIVINGDFKHEFGKNLKQEWNEVSELLDFLVKKLEVIIVRGNHDNFIKTIAKKFNVEVKDEYEYGEIKFVHGHKEANGDKIVIGHEHPSLVIRDKVGVVAKLPCFLISKEMVVLPAMSPLASGTDVSSASNEEYLSPILKSYDVDVMEIYAISDELMHFSSVGKIKRVI
ncbi:MAG: metallophosphoesterase [Thermoplasmatales archaeon]|nr:metallophosphoesterase [Thermoplasmatales archaeon]